MQKLLKVLVIDDSAFMRKMISNLLNTDEGIEVIGTARNGLEALEKMNNLEPDIITLDVEMPIMNGLETLERLKKITSIPIIMLSSLTQSGAAITIEALEKGAFDFVGKPSGSISLNIDEITIELINKVKIAHQAYQHKRNRPSSINNDHHMAQKKEVSYFNKRISFRSDRQNDQPQNIILVGTSTGGPRALDQLFSTLPKLDDTAILVVQHMPPSFTKSLAIRLNQSTRHNVKEAEHLELLKGGMIYIAQGGYHMEIEQNPHLHIKTNLDKPRNGHRPSVDALYESAAQIERVNIFTVTLTGMGRDGTLGLQKLTQKRHVYNIAEDESTCVVYGMPKSIVEASLAHKILPLTQISKHLFQLLTDK